MKLLKPSWVTHDGKPIFSVDIHPDGTRFATGGQGEDSGRVVIWNMGPVKSEKEERNEKIPKLLCQMNNHLACVNCVRWSNNGKYLASGGDDKIIMIWQTSRYTGSSTVFGSSGKLVNVETWRCNNTLRGHTGDILDLAWSPNDVWLASCSVDNTVIIWNALKFPEQIRSLRGHTGLVKGVTWDPVGTYLATQSDDKSLRIWRTMDWQQETKVTKPFDECGGTTHVLRLNWSPDGHYLVSAHAMNNSGPTAQIIERDGWKTNMDFVGHRKAITAVKFNPNILSKKMKKDAPGAQQYCCCAIGSRDRSLSIWVTALKRPLVVTHDLFSNSVLDISWSRTGMELLACSWDGTVAFIQFSTGEIGNPLSHEEKNHFYQKVYGKSIAAGINSQMTKQIIETPAMLNIQQQKQQQQLQEMNKQPTLTNGNSNLSPTNKQIETRTPDGRRRITPIFIAPQPDFGYCCFSDAPLPFSANSEPTFTSSKETSKIVVEKQNVITSPNSNSLPGKSETTKPSFPMEEIKLTALESKVAEKAKPASAETGSTAKIGDVEKENDTVVAVQKPREKSTGTIEKTSKRKLDTIMPHSKRHRKEKDIIPTSTPIIPVTPNIGISSVNYPSSPGINLPCLSIDKSQRFHISGIAGTESEVSIQIENGVTAGLHSLHKMRYYKGGELLWEHVLSAKISGVSGSRHLICVSCEDCTISIFTLCGRRILSPLAINSNISILNTSGHYVMVVTCKGTLSIWNMNLFSAVIKNESLDSILTDLQVTVEASQLTEQGIPIISLSNGYSYIFRPELGSWLQVASTADSIQQVSNHHSSLPSRTQIFTERGQLATLQNRTTGGGRLASRVFNTDHALQQSTTVSHLEKQVCAALALESGKEYHFWFLAYVRYIVQEGLEKKLREVCDNLLGPLFKTKTSGWEPKILSLDKRKLLEEIIPIIGSNLTLQRLFTEYKEQLDSTKT
ncbi:protein HIRA-like isoform X2 [Tubulanus polymorphus]|uniref:protein HIRA-like isoform X2 n=1 Tax=Tubulanus polymorphus TaxID=672921 RepID=UPI003DA2B2BE